MIRLAVLKVLVIACSLAVSHDAVSNDVQNPTEKFKEEKQKIVDKWDDIRSTMLSSLERDPAIEPALSDSMKLRLTFQVFRVSEYMKIFDVYQDKEFLRLRLRHSENLPELEEATMKLHYSALISEATRIRKRLDRLDADDRSGAGLRLHLKERREQLDDARKRNWKIPMTLEPSTT